MVRQSPKVTFPAGLFATQIMQSPSQITLVIGDMTKWKADGRELPVLDGFQFVALEDLSVQLFQDIQPQVVLSPLVSEQFDAVEVAFRLAACGYNGRYRAVTETVPNPRMILREIQVNAPQIDFDLLVLPQAAAND